MGLFGSRKKTQVGTSVARVIEDGSLPDSIITGALKAQIEGDSQPVEHAFEELGSGLGMRVHAMYRYGKTGYANGLPSGTTMTNLQGRDTIIQAIEAEAGAGVDLDYYKVGPLNLTHLGWRTLVEDFGYNQDTNTFMVDSQEVYLDNMQPVVSDASLAEMENGSLDQWGLPPTAGESPSRKYLGSLGQFEKQPLFLVDPAVASDQILVRYSWEVTAPVTVEGSVIDKTALMSGEMRIALPDVDMEADYHQAKYTQNSRVGYWIYRIDSGVNPDIEAIFDTAPQPDGTFFPMAYFRLNKQSTLDSMESSSYRRLLKYLALDFKDTVTAINENPDIADVEQAVFMLAVPADTTDERERCYLFDFFSNLWLASNQQNATSRSMAAYDMAGRFNEDRPASTIVIQDAKFKMALSWSTIIKRRVAGSIGPIGSHDSGKTSKADSVPGASPDGGGIVWTTSVPAHYYRRQLTESVFEEIQVLGLKMTYYVFEGYTTTGDENNEDLLMIPLDYAITSLYQISDREVLYARSMHYIFNSRVVTKLKWYQTGVFKALLIIAAVVITIITNGATIKGLIAAISAGGAAATAAYWAIATFLVKFIVVSFVVKKFVQAVGGKVALILAAIAAIAGFYQIAANGGTASAPWAKELLAVSSNLSNASGKQFQSDFRELLGDFKSFQEFVKQETEKLDKVNALLDGNTHLVPTVIFGESPDDFYQRTVHSGNIGVLGIDAVSSYVEAALSLPKLSDIQGDFV